MASFVSTSVARSRLLFVTLSISVFALISVAVVFRGHISVYSNGVYAELRRHGHSCDGHYALKLTHRFQSRRPYNRSYDWYIFRGWHYNGASGRC